MIKGITSIILGEDVSRLQKNSQSIVDVFTKTVNKLNVVNKEIEVNVSKRELEIAKLRDESTRLGHIKANNDKVISKLNSIFKD